jgi:hypothetical protein
MMAKRIEKVECRPEFMEYCRCMLDIGEYMGLWVFGMVRVDLMVG